MLDAVGSIVSVQKDMWKLQAQGFMIVILFGSRVVAGGLKWSRQHDGVGRPSSSDWRPPMETDANTDSSLEPLEGAWSYWRSP